MLSVIIQKDGIPIVSDKFENITICYKNYEFENSKALIHCVSEKDFYSMSVVATQMKKIANNKLDNLFTTTENSNTEYVRETEPFDRALEFRLPEYELQVSDDSNDNRTIIDQQVNIIIMTGIKKIRKSEGQAVIKLYGVSDYHEWCFVVGAAMEIQLQCAESMARISKLAKSSGAKD